MVKDIISGSTGSSPYGFTAIGNTLYFRANDGTNGIELWKSGTLMVKDINSGSSGSYPEYFTSFGNEVYFSANNSFHGYELWKTLPQAR